NAAGTIRVSNCTFLSNSSTGGAGALGHASIIIPYGDPIPNDLSAFGGSGYGGAVFNLNGALSLHSDTFARNGVTPGGLGADADGADVFNLGLDGSGVG